MAALLVKPQKFSGQSDEDPTEWLEDFLLAANANSWNADRKKNAFGAYLRKGAREWYIEYARTVENHNWDQLQQAFENKYCDEDFKEQWLEELRSLKQRKTETVEEYYYQIKKMAARADLDAATTMPYFIRGLLPDIKGIVKTHEPENLTAALRKAKQYEQGKVTKRHKKSKKRYVNLSDESESSSSEDEKPQKKKKEKKEKKKKVSSDDELDELTKRFNKLQINLM
jgi:Retrotransposon gag protein